jgi:hypothetical protein
MHWNPSLENWKLMLELNINPLLSMLISQRHNRLLQFNPLRFRSKKSKKKQRSSQRRSRIRENKVIKRIRKRNSHNPNNKRRYLNRKLQLRKLPSLVSLLTWHH